MKDVDFIHHMPKMRPNYQVFLIGKKQKYLTKGTIVGVVSKYPFEPKRCRGGWRIVLRLCDPSCSGPYSHRKELKVHVFSGNVVLPEGTCDGCVVRLTGVQLRSGDVYADGRLSSGRHLSVFSWSEVDSNVITVETGGCPPHFHTLTPDHDPLNEHAWLCWVRQWWLSKKNVSMPMSSEQLAIDLSPLVLCSHLQESKIVAAQGHSRRLKIVRTDSFQPFLDPVVRKSSICSISNSGSFMLECLITDIIIEHVNGLQIVTRLRVLDGTRRSEHLPIRVESNATAIENFKIEIFIEDERCARILLTFCDLMESLHGLYTVKCLKICLINLEIASLFFVRLVGLQVVADDNSPCSSPKLMLCLSNKPRVEALPKGSKSEKFLMNNLKNTPEVAQCLDTFSTVASAGSCSGLGSTFDSFGEWEDVSKAYLSMEMSNNCPDSFVSTISTILDSDNSGAVEVSLFSPPSIDSFETLNRSTSICPKESLTPMGSMDQSLESENVSKDLFSSYDSTSSNVSLMETTVDRNFGDDCISSSAMVGDHHNDVKSLDQFSLDWVKVKLVRCAVVTGVWSHMPLLSFKEALKPHPATSFRVKCRLQCPWLSHSDSPTRLQLRARCPLCRTVYIFCDSERQSAYKHMLCLQCNRSLTYYINIWLKLADVTADSCGGQLSTLLTGRRAEQFVGRRLVPSRAACFMRRVDDVFRRLTTAPWLELGVIHSGKHLLIHNTLAIELFS